MILRDRNIDPDSAVVERVLIFSRDAVGAAFNANIRKITLGHPFVIEQVAAWAAAASPGTRVDVLIGGVSALAAPAIPGIGAAAPAVLPLAAAASLVGSAAQALAVNVLTQAAEAVTDLTVMVTVRFRVHRGDPGTV